MVAKRMALSNRDLVMAGRTHGVVAEPTSFGHKVALWAFELDRDRDRLRRARETVSVGAISGAVGTYAQVDPRVEEEVCEARTARRRGLEPDRRARPARRAREHARDHRVHAGLGRDRDPSPRADRGPRGAGAVHPGPEGLERDAPQAEPRPLRARDGARPRGPRQPPDGAREHGALARARHLPFVCRARDPARLDDRVALHARGDERGAGRARGVPRSHAREPAGGRRTGVLAERVAGARRCRDVPRRGVRARASRRCDRLGRGCVVRGPRGGRSWVRDDRRPGERAVRPGPALRNLDVVFDRLEKVEVREA